MMMMLAHGVKISFPLGYYWKDVPIETLSQGLCSTTAYHFFSFVNIKTFTTIVNGKTYLFHLKHVQLLLAKPPYSVQPLSSHYLRICPIIRTCLPPLLCLKYSAIQKPKNMKINLIILILANITIQS